jgi:hypothetical protein
MSGDLGSDAGVEVHYRGHGFRGYRNGDAAAWLATAPGVPTRWEEPPRREAGHWLNVRMRAAGSRFHLLLGGGNAASERAEFDSYLRLFGQCGVPLAPPRRSARGSARRSSRSARDAR